MTSDFRSVDRATYTRRRLLVAGGALIIPAIVYSQVRGNATESAVPSEPLPTPQPTPSPSLPSLHRGTPCAHRRAGGVRPRRCGGLERGQGRRSARPPPSFGFRSGPVRWIFRPGHEAISVGI